MEAIRVRHRVEPLEKDAFPQGPGTDLKTVDAEGLHDHMGYYRAGYDLGGSTR